MSSTLFRLGLGLCAAAVLLGLPTVCRADEASLEQRLARQEAETAALRRELAALKPTQTPVVVTPTPARGSGRTEVRPYEQRAPDGAPALLHATGIGGLRWGGYVHFLYDARSDQNSFFDLHRLVLKLDGQVSRCVAIEGEIEYEHGGVSDELEGEVVVEYLQVPVTVFDWLVPKAGALLIPFGRFNLHHDDPLNDFTRRPFTGTFLVPTGFPQPGVGVEGVVPLGCDRILSYDVAVTNGYKDAFTADEGVRDARQPWQQDNNAGKQVWGRVGLTFTRSWFDWLDLGLSGTWAVYDDADEDDLLGYGVDFMARKGPFEVKGEWLAYDYERNPLDPPGSIQGQSGLWLEAAYHFMPPFLRCKCGPLLTPTSHFTLAARWQTMDLDDLATGATFEDDVDAFSVALNYRPTERTVFRVDYTWYDAVNEEDVQEFTLSFSTYF